MRSCLWRLEQINREIRNDLHLAKQTSFRTVTREIDPRNKFPASELCQELFTITQVGSGMDGGKAIRL